jgi:hypothetical protein
MTPLKWAGLVTMNKIELFSNNTTIGVIDVYNDCIVNKCFVKESFDFYLRGWF